MWTHRVRSTPESFAMKQREGSGWRRYTWREADGRVRAIAGALLEMGLKLEARCAIHAVTSVEWVLADMGIVCAGGATTTIYPSDTIDHAVFVLRDSGSVVLFCDTDALADAIHARRAELPELRTIVTFGGQDRPNQRIRSLAAWEAAGRAWNEAHPGALDAVQDQLTPDHIATLIYTSGTTGRPKGVVLAHDAWVYVAEAIDELGVVGPDDVQLLFLPLAHVFAKVMQVTFIRLGVPTAVDGSMDRFLDNMADVRPTWLAAVPRVFEKAQARIISEVRDRGPVAAAAFRAALELGKRVARMRRAGQAVPPHMALAYRVADRVFFRTIRARFGGRLRFCVSGGAPLSVEVAEFFDACGIVICEGYGLTETAAASCVNSPDAIVFGTVGRPLAGCEIQLADDGELLIRSRGVMKGYHNLPEATAEALDADGWLHTGDLGRQLDSGHVKITGRKKDILVTAGGKNIAPAHFEGLLKARSSLVGDVVMLGDRHNFCSALIALDLDAAQDWARHEGVAFGSLKELNTHAAVRDALQQAIDDVNRTLPGYEKVRKFAIVTEPFTVENGLLTASLKPRRRVIEQRHAALVSSFYEGTVARA